MHLKKYLQRLAFTDTSRQSFANLNCLVEIEPSELGCIAINPSPIYPSQEQLEHLGLALNF